MADCLAFERVPLDLARQALDEIPGIESGASVWHARQRAPRVLRRDPLPEDFQLTEATSNWLAQLPAEVRPHRLEQAFPRVANELAVCWYQPVRCEAYFKQLLLVDRPSRGGFPEAVALELNRLFEYFETVCPPRADPRLIDAWEKAGVHWRDTPAAP